MKVLLLSCSTGGGHNSTAAAIGAAVEARGGSWETVNVLQFLPRSTAEFITKGHDFSYRHIPKLYGVGYRFEEKHPPVQVYRKVIKGADRLQEAVAAARPDAIVSVHVFASMMLTELRRTGGLTVPVYFVATDYTCSPGVGQLDADAYFIPHEDLRQEFAAAGVPAERIVASGIPVREAFAPAEDRAALKRSLGVGPAGKLVVMAGGSMGCGPIPQIATLLAPRLGPEDRLLVVCGSNKSMHRQLRAVFRRKKQVQILGYTKDMARLVRAADLLITKAGGLSSTEAVAAETPVLYINAVPGCESRNLQFMTAHGYAAAGKHAWDVTAMAIGLLAGDAARAAMVERRRGRFPTHAADTVCDVVYAKAGRKP